MTAERRPAGGPGPAFGPGRRPGGGGGPHMMGMGMPPAKSTPWPGVRCMVPSMSASWSLPCARSIAMS